MYACSKNLAKRTVSDNVWKDRGYEIVLNGYQRGLASIRYKILIKKGSDPNINEGLPQELHKSVITKFK